MRIWTFIGKWGMFLELGLEGRLFGATTLERISRSISPYFTICYLLISN